MRVHDENRESESERERGVYCVVMLCDNTDNDHYVNVRTMKKLFDFVLRFSSTRRIERFRRESDGCSADMTKDMEIWRE